MNILFIGGTGLISTAIARQLLNDGHDVTLFNRGKTESRLPDDAEPEIVVGDRKNYAEFENTFSDRTFDVVVDMVAFHPDDTASAIRAFRGRCGQFIHCSTVCVYSGPPVHVPVPETEPFHSIGQYGKNKAAIEEMLFQEWETNRFPITILRPSHSYGEGGRILRPWGPWETFIGRLRAGKPIVVPGDGTGLWASCHVDDVARGFIGTMGSDWCHGQAYNITGDEWMTWNTYHEQVAEVVGGTFEPVCIPTEVLVEAAPEISGGLKEIFAWTSIFNNDKIKRDTDYTAQRISLKEGTRRTLEWMESEGLLKPSDGSDARDAYEDQLIAAWKDGKASLPRLEK